jgi:hypothetical protein
MSSVNEKSASTKKLRLKDYKRNLKRLLRLLVGLQLRGDPIETSTEAKGKGKVRKQSTNLRKTRHIDDYVRLVNKNSKFFST